MHEWPVWRLVVAKVATLTEIDTSWSVDDIVKGNDILDIQNALKEK